MYPELQDVQFRVDKLTDQPDNANIPYLRMRATAVYHYKQTDYSQTAPTPIACVSSFYDPTNSVTARNRTGLPNWTPPTGFGGGGTDGLSNNGIVYGPPTKGVADYQNLLTYQSKLVYANGRSIDDGLLAGALAATAAGQTLTLSQLSTIDAAICALQILDDSISPSSTVIPHGAIFETAFLDGRQVKAVHSNDATTTADERFVNVDSGANQSTTYDLPLQDRQPVEIRATVLDLGKLRTKTIGGTTPSQEYLIPNSGIIYATRDDALVDKTSSNTDKTANKLESSVDYELDPTRRPNAIVLANGSNISREPNNNYLDAEKGLIVATNLPSYIKGNFNLHSGEEFTTALDNTWSNFYTRSTLNSNFACRKNDPRLSVNGVDQCSTGDTWRTAAVISDAMTLLSDNYRFGFRNEGDYDWNNNSSDPTSLSSRSFATASGTNTNFQFNTYAPKTSNYSGTSTNGFESQFNTSTTSDCSAVSGNCSGYYGWRVGEGSSYLFNFVTPVVRQIQMKNAKDYGYEVCDTDTYTDCNSPTGDPKHWVMTNVAYNGSGSGQSNWGTGGQDIVGQPVNSIKTGTMGNPPAKGWDNPNFLRRVAFRRNPITGALVTPLRVYGTNSSGQIGLFDPASTSSMNSMAVAGGTNDTLIPALQLDSNGQWKPVLWNAISNFGVSTNENNATKWLQSATSTTYNVIIAAGDTPARTTEDNGGLHNYVRFAESWAGVNAKISGSFMQLRKSSYATAPFATSLTTADTSLDYATNNGGNKLPFYQPPIRLWGYDVGILSQSPDRFSQKLVVPVGDLPNEYFREVGRDDPWVQNLLCAKDDANTSYVIDRNERPSICQS
jgi:hypothetical protein